MPPHPTSSHPTPSHPILSQCSALAGCSPSAQVREKPGHMDMQELFHPEPEIRQTRRGAQFSKRVAYLRPYVKQHFVSQQCTTERTVSKGRLIFLPMTAPACLPITNRFIYKISVIVTRQSFSGATETWASGQVRLLTSSSRTVVLPAPNFQNPLFTSAWGLRKQISNSLQISYLEQKPIPFCKKKKKKENQNQIKGGALEVSAHPCHETEEPFCCFVGFLPGSDSRDSRDPQQEHWMLRRCRPGSSPTHHRHGAADTAPMALKHPTTPRLPCSYK